MHSPTNPLAVISRNATSKRIACSSDCPGRLSWSTGPLQPGKFSVIYETGSPGFYMIGCFFHYDDPTSMRTVLIVQ